MPFYQKLSHMRARSGFQLVAASAESAETTTQYLRQGGVDVDAVGMLRANEIPTNGTPTLVLVDTRGVVIQSWLGQLNTAQEAEVTAQITAALERAA
jgi:hypothetical protein